MERARVLREGSARGRNKTDFLLFQVPSPPGVQSHTAQVRGRLPPAPLLHPLSSVSVFVCLSVCLYACLSLCHCFYVSVVPFKLFCLSVTLSTTPVICNIPSSPVFPHILVCPSVCLSHFPCLSVTFLSIPLLCNFLSSLVLYLLVCLSLSVYLFPLQLHL